MIASKAKIPVLLVVMLCLIAFAFCFIAEDVTAFGNSNAIAYSDLWALSHNPAYVHYSSDCANFVSQILRAGGLSDNYPYWYYYYSSHTHLNAWSVADTLKNYIKNHNKGYKYGSWKKQASGQFYAYVNNSGNMNGGNEVIFYDWEGDGVIDHTSFNVRTGTDPDCNLYGDLINQHNHDRKNAIWHIDPYNRQNYTTEIYLFVIY